MRTTIVILLLTALTACAGSGQQEQAQALQIAGARGDTCAAAIEDDPRLAPIAVHAPLTDAPATEAQMLDFGTPAPSLAPILAEWRVALWRCRTVTMAAAEDAAPAAVRPLRIRYAASDDVIDALARRQITWGEANRRRDAIARASAEDLDTAIAERTAAIDAAEPDVSGPIAQALAFTSQVVLAAAGDALTDAVAGGGGRGGRAFHAGAGARHGEMIRTVTTHTVVTEGARPTSLLPPKRR